MGRPLPNYEEYFDKIAVYCEAVDLVIERKECDSDGLYVPTRRRIVIDRDLDESSEIAVLLHEIGHTLDDALKDQCEEKKIDRAYTAFYKNEATKKQVQIVYECEKRAWEYGRAIAKKLRIKLGKWYTVEEGNYLADYGQEEQSGT